MRLRLLEVATFWCVTFFRKLIVSLHSANGKALAMMLYRFSKFYTVEVVGQWPSMSLGWVHSFIHSNSVNYAMSLHRLPSRSQSDSKLSKLA
ncbi:unnamed protein product [Amoebophrya sp. A25]|nr:unnamed protein product [Amoebophrya sp. A25]|eukprot:GSA25T00026427001.1